MLGSRKTSEETRRHLLATGYSSLDTPDAVIDHDGYQVWRAASCELSPMCNRYGVVHGPNHWLPPPRSGSRFKAFRENQTRMGRGSWADVELVIQMLQNKVGKIQDVALKERCDTPPLTPNVDRGPLSSLSGHKPLSVKTIHPPPIPTAGPTPPASPVAHVKSQPAYKYLITPYHVSPSSSLLSDGTPSYILYSPNWPTNPRSSTLSSVSSVPSILKPEAANSPRSSDVATEAPAEIIVGEEGLEARYSSSSLISSNGASLRPGPGSKWLETYHDWVSRSKRAYARQRRRESRRASHTLHCDSHGHHTPMNKKSSKGPFKDEGESTLWMVEGLLLSAWLCLQGDCAGVEYAPWGVTSDLQGNTERSVNREAEDEHMYTLEKNTVGCVIRHALDGLSWC
ncbi:hypothetical protein QBC37DRAFT_485850 [Rhypophila decipiens]|uniref:Uncharacterized protein n=1 Tax=Rhypophila decipiens TaxID=261697 RepID=A0AAN6XZK8_9PEZI|nr:hypothetical protein QBC37DRAFT_485850 [Rhypophila decipiens]